LRRDTLRNVLRQRSAVAGLIILGTLVLVAIFAPVIAPHDPLLSMLDSGETGIKRGQAPCIHLLGCPADQPQHIMGPDLEPARRVQLCVVPEPGCRSRSILTVGFAILVGTTMAPSPPAGGHADNITMRSLDIVLAFPSPILATRPMTVLGFRAVPGTIAIAFVSIPIYARVMRGSVLSTREQEFVTASRALGESSRGILSRRSS
jgi:ABC-type dipeptide/oligopeptide/nickel transport system permease subunit